MMTDFEGKTSYATNLIKKADYIVVLSGAGISFSAPQCRIS